MNEFITEIETDPEKILDNVVTSVEKDLGEKLAEGDERRLFIESLIPIIIAIQNKTVDESKQNYLEYARNSRVDVIAENYNNTKRNLAQESTCAGKAVLTKALDKDIVIPKDTKVTPDGLTVFKVKEDSIVKAGKTEGDLMLISASTGKKYNGYGIGEIKTIVDPIPYVKQIFNTEISHSGTDLENDDSYKARAKLYFESLSVTGPEGAYEYLTYLADASITAVKVISPNPGEVKILIVIDNGEDPGESIVKKVLDKCNSRIARPLTDKVSAGKPDTINYDIELTYYLDKNLSTYENKWRKSIEGEDFDCKDGAIKEYVLWQQSEIGKSINPDELRYKIQNAARYKVEDKMISGVKRILMTSPEYKMLNETEFPKVSNINITYGGME